MANVPRLSKILRGKDTKPQTELEAAIKYAIDTAGGGGDEYETVAEIEVGQMEEEAGLYNYMAEGQYDVQVDPTAEYYLQPQNIRLNTVIGDEANGFVYNFDTETDEPTDTPAYAFQFASFVAAVMSDTDLSNTTVKILKKVSGGGSISVDSELSDTSENPVQNKVITAALAPVTPLVCDVSASGFDITVNDTPAELNAAWAANRVIIIPVANIRLKMTECNFTDDTHYLFKFFAVKPATSTGVLETYSLMFNDTMTATLDSKNYTPTT